MEALRIAYPVVAKLMGEDDTVIAKVLDAMTMRLRGIRDIRNVVTIVTTPSSKGFKKENTAQWEDTCAELYSVRDEPHQRLRVSVPNCKEFAVKVAGSEKYIKQFKNSPKVTVIEEKQIEDWTFIYYRTEGSEIDRIMVKHPENVVLKHISLKGMQDAGVVDADGTVVSPFRKVEPTNLFA